MAVPLGKMEFRLLINIIHAKGESFKNPLKLANGHASSSTTPAAHALLDASTIPLQAHEVSHQKQAPILLQEEQASIPQQQEQAPLPLQQEQVPILPSNSTVPFMNHLIYSKYWNVGTISPVHKKDVMKASVMLEKKKEYATILAFDVKVTQEARELSDELGVKVFMADIIYHLFD
uniref:Translation initiation factor if-2 n=1 Tax=Solanum tuberosum TaxID=4113 RepID=M1DPK2_SOLTU